MTAREWRASLGAAIALLASCASHEDLRDAVEPELRSLREVARRYDDGEL